MWFVVKEKRFQPWSGFTLVELLVVIAIIGILIGMLLPAVQQVREAGRRTVCQNNLRQLTLGMLNFESTFGFLPSSGWGPPWVGDPDRGFGRKQPGGWMYSLLPYIEQQNLFDLPGDGDATAITASQRARAGDLTQTRVSTFNCPSRRDGGPYPYILPTPGFWDYLNAETRPMQTRGDYAICTGDGQSGEQGALWPSTYLEADTSYNWSSAGYQSGISFQASEVKLAEVFDGTSNTFAIGEKFLNPDFYFTGLGGADNHCWSQGFDRDTNRWCAASIPPLRDRPGADLVFNFGSAHPATFNMTRVDGSVVSLSYDVDGVPWANTANRQDGRPGNY